MPTTNGRQRVPETMPEATEVTANFSSARHDQPLDPTATCDFRPETRLDHDQVTEQQPDPGITAETRRDEVTVDRQPAGSDATGIHERILSTAR
jgi:hypothetical protein